MVASSVSSVLPLRTVFRPTGPADAPAISALLAEVFGPEADPANLDPRVLHWKYWTPRPDWSASRSFVLARGGEILAHAGILPGTCEGERGRLATLHLIDWAARPDALGHGADLLRRLAHMADVLLAIGGSALTRELLPALRFCDARPAEGFTRSLWPPPLPGWPPRPRRLYHFARSVFWTVTAKSGLAGTWETRRLEPADVALATLPTPSPRPGLAVLTRTAPLLRYLLACPVAPVVLHEIRDPRGRRGYFLLAFARAHARLADCWVDSSDPTDWEALVQLAVQTARDRPGVAEVVAISNDPWLSAGLLACGFRHRTTEPVRLRAASGTALPIPAVRVQMFDSDAIWRQADRPEFWT